jgi:hypothetical protein
MSDEILKAMIRKYMFEQTSRSTLSDEERINHIAAEARYIIAHEEKSEDPVRDGSFALGLLRHRDEHRQR